ncbi:hypothetical protein ABZ313_10235 [Streptomyces sp. NPDC006251]|uniref:hypothetical protein n=1 Tax=Streptomyces sp. NPDC006251 TaxID=3155718 RepID=UPI0033BD659F
MSELFTAYAVLSRHRLVIGAPRVSVSVHEAGRKNSYLFRKDFEPEDTWSPADVAKSMAEEVEAGRRPGEIGSVYADADGLGEVVIRGGGREKADLLRLGASTLLDHISVELVTHTDHWLPYDLRGRPQPEVYAANGPRLAAALRDIAEVFGTETDPDDPTYFARPSETGAENFFDQDGNALDVWESFEIPYRYRAFTQTPRFGRIGCRRTAEGEVRYVPVQDERGIVGHLWASDEENAASFEPLEVGDGATYHAGLAWLERLRSAHDRGLSPSAALAEVSATADTSAGRVAPACEPRTVALAALRDRSRG